MITRALGLSVVLIFIASFAHAQETRGTISGTVVDEQGTAVPEQRSQW
jgi:hypothetical protein